MMFWKFQSHRSESTESVAEPQVAPMPQPQPAPPPPMPSFAPPVTPPAPVVPQPPVTAPAAPAYSPPSSPPASEPAPSYQQAAERTMRFLAESLQIPSWALFKNMNGTLQVVAGTGDYQRYLTGRELTIGRLSDLPTVNVLGASPPMTVNGGIDRRSGGIDPATVAPYGVPLLDTDGNLFAILCALGERIPPQRVAQMRPLLDYTAGMLGAVLRSELTLEEASRRTERAQADALVDPLTGLHNRRAWDQLLATEDQRCARHGYDAVIFVIDVDGLKAVNDRFGHEKGDELIRNAATALERSVRRTDVVARVGGDEFAILAVKCDARAASRIRDHIESTLMRANSPATVGFSVRSEAGDLFEAWRQADGAMYHRKRGKPSRGGRASDNPQPQLAQPAPAAANAAAVANAPASVIPSDRSVVIPSERGAQAPSDVEGSASALEPAKQQESGEASLVAQILEKVLPALVTGIQKAVPPPPPPPPPTPVFAAPQPPPVATRPLIVPGEAEIPTYTPPPSPAPPPVSAPPPAPAPQPGPPPALEEPAAPAAQPSQPSEDLIDIVSRLSRLSDADRRLLDVFFKGSK